jgi:glycosyltransferase involved in cell wall biosynthesis
MGFSKEIYMKKYRFHLLGLVHLPQSRKYTGCAFTQKNLKLAKMLTKAGHEVFFYGSEGSDVVAYCDDSPNLYFIETHKLSDIRQDYGDGDNRFELGYDHTSQMFRHDFNDSQKKLSTLKFYSEAIKHINKVKKDDDFLLVTQGTYHRPIADAVNLYLTVEPGIGYRGSWTNFRAFESSYIQNFTYGSEHPRQSINGIYYDRVIPNYFDPADFGVSKKKGNYYLFVGRMILRKGVWTAVKATQAIGAPLLLAGQLDPEIDLKTLPEHCKYVGTVGVEERKKLMGEAIATFTPSVYLEPFAGVHIESMLCGTPPITTNFGVFPETIPDYLNGRVGFRCNTLDDFVGAARLAKKMDIDVRFIAEYAQRFTMDRVYLDYEKWFNDLYQLYLSAVDPKVKGWHHIM